MKAKLIACCTVAVAMAVSPAFAAGKKKSAKRAPQQTSQSGPVGAAVGAAGAVAGGAVATAGMIATAPFNPALMGPVSTINAPSCKRGDMVTINGQKMRCQ